MFDLTQFDQLLSRYWVAWVFAVVLLVVLLDFVVSRILVRFLRKAEKTRNLWDDAVLFALHRPLEVAIWLFGVNAAAMLTARLTETAWIDWLVRVNQIGVVVLLVWALYRFINRAMQNLTSPEHLESPMDYTTATAVGKLLQASILITGALVILQTLGFSISGVLAFGGIGGIAVGFAARDLLANFFGAAMVYLDKPFAVGDWIRSPDKSIEGVVEDIGWRRTVIRTFDKRPLYVPNSVFNTISVENPSRMLNRRIYETIGIRYQDISQMAPIVSQVKELLLKSEEIDTEQTLIVNFNAFNASSVDFFVYAYTRTTNWIEFHQVKQNVLLKIAEIIEANGAEIAFPTQTLHLHQGEQQLPQTPMESIVGRTAVDKES